MHAEAVRYVRCRSKRGLLHDESRPVKCDECNVRYYLHYDRYAEASVTFCSILADEIVTARHPDHSGNVVLDLAARTKKYHRNPKWCGLSGLSW